jgi:hypothetical protein
MHYLKLFHCFQMRLLCILLLQILQVAVFNSLQMRAFTIRIEKSSHRVLWFFSSCRLFLRSQGFTCRFLSFRRLFCIRIIFFLLFNLFRNRSSCLRLNFLSFTCLRLRLHSIHQHFECLFTLNLRLSFH